MNPPIDPARKIRNRIAHMSERLARWDQEANEIETWWAGGTEYRKFCEAMARAARTKKADLEAELQQLQG